MSSCRLLRRRVSCHMRVHIATACLVASWGRPMMRISVRPIVIVSTVMSTVGSWVTGSVNRWPRCVFVRFVRRAWPFSCLIWGASSMTIASSAMARAYFSCMIMTTARTSSCVGQLSCCGFYLMDVLFQCVCYLGRVLFTLSCAAICARISTMAAMVVRWVRRGLSM